MQSITSHINKLLFEVDCVIIPGLGGFVANYSPATLNKQTGLMNPPGKGLIFNKNLVKNDGLLAHNISQEENISYQQATDLINEFVETSKHILSSGQRIEIPDVGYLYFDKERNLQFLPVYSVNFLTDSFGLSPVIAREVVKTANETIKVLHPEVKQEIEQKEKVEEKKIAFEEAKVISIEKAKEDKKVVAVKRSRSRYYWAAAVLLPIAFYSVWIPVRTDFIQTGHLSINDFNPFHHKPATEYNIRKVVDVKTEIKLPAAYLIVETDSSDEAMFASGEVTMNVGEVDTTNVVNPHVENSIPDNLPGPEKRYHIIAGCFVNYDNALNQISTLEGTGVKASLFGKMGDYHRVSLGSYTTREEAMQQLSAVKANGNPNAWLLEE